MAPDRELPVAVKSALDRFTLGRMVEPPLAVKEAWSNDVFAVRTESGRYAIKLFRHDAEAELRTPTAIESVALETGRIPMARPVRVPATGSWLAEFEPAERRWWARCHHWVAGRPLSTVAPTSETVRDVGRSVGVLHALRLDGGDTSQLPPMDVGRWDRAIAAAAESGVAWAAELAGHTVLVEDLATRLDRLREERRPMRMSHRDLDPKNAVQRPDGRVAITDWDYAGPAIPGVELVVAAVSSSGGVLCSDAELVEEFVAAYRSSGGDAEPADTLAMTTEAALEDIAWVLRNVEGYLNPTAGDDRALRGRLASEPIASFPDRVSALEARARDVAELL